MSQPQKLDELLRTWWASEAHKAGAVALQTFADARTVRGMTTDADYEIIRRIALFIEDEAIEHPGGNPKDKAKAYVRNTLDNGWISDMDDTPVWELVALLGHDRNDMDSLAVFTQIAALIEENDFFND